MNKLLVAFDVNDNSDWINVGINHEKPVYSVEMYPHMYSPLREYLQFEYTG